MTAAPHSLQPGTAKLSKTQLRVLKVLQDAGEPLFNGTLAARTGLRFNSDVFGSLEAAGLIEGHPYRLTEAGHAALPAPPEAI